MTKEYRERYGMQWDARTSDEVIDVLEKARQNHTRLCLSFGHLQQVFSNMVIGLDWLEEYGSRGYIGHRAGSMLDNYRNGVPLLIHTRQARASSGQHLRDHCIIRIRTSRGGQVLWQHPSYHHGKITIHRKPIPGVLPVEIRQDGTKRAGFKDIASAWDYVTKLGLTAERVRDSELA